MREPTLSSSRITFHSSWSDPHPDLAEQLLAHPGWNKGSTRTVLQFGPIFDATNGGSLRPPQNAMPAALKELAQRIHQTDRTGGPLCTQAIISYYGPGQGIKPHIDRPHLFGPTIASVTLRGTALLDLSHQGATESYTLTPGTTMILTGRARYSETHAIRPDGSPRVTISFRSICPNRKGIEAQRLARQINRQETVRLAALRLQRTHRGRLHPPLNMTERPPPRLIYGPAAARGTAPPPPSAVPLTMAAIHHGPQEFLIDITVGGTQVSALVDTGATGDFVDLDWCRSRGAHISPVLPGSGA
jgi:hypothetical protein